MSDELSTSQRGAKTLARMRDKNSCQIHKHRDKVPVDLHHIWPQEFGGPTRAENLIVLCANGHRLVHEYLELLINGNGKVVWSIRMLYGPKTRKVAELGYSRYLRSSI